MQILVSVAVVCWAHRRRIVKCFGNNESVRIWNQIHVLSRNFTLWTEQQQENSLGWSQQRFEPSTSQLRYLLIQLDA